MAKVIKEDSSIGRKILEIESLMDKYGIIIEGNNLILNVEGKEFKIGRDSDRFPRYIDEPFILID